MSNSFIQDENKKAGLQNAFQLNVRLFRNLSLFRKLFLFSFLFIILSSAAPSYVRWYSGNYASGAAHFELSKLWIIVAVAIFCRIAAWMSFEMSGMWSAQDIHADMVKALSNTRTTYFDENPSSRLINRLIRDFDEARGTAIIFVGDLFNAMIEIISISVVGAFASPYVLFLIAPLFFFFYYFQYYRSSMLSHARRLSAVATSDVIARQTDLIEGREVFLLYGKSKQLLSRMKKSFYSYAQASLMMAHIEAWGSFWIRMTAEAFSFCVMLFLIYAIHQQKLDSTWVGVILSSLFGITGSIGWLDFATGLISRSVPHLERVFEIVDLPSEESEEWLTKPISKPPASADLVFQNFSASYRKDSADVLHGLNLSIKLGQKTALVGRTGSGKSTLIQALFRMVYVKTGGIFLNGQSIYDFSVRSHRAKFAVIPQSPYLFAGTLRTNLDPGNFLTDDELKVSLNAVELSFDLGHEVVEEGKNLSHGERQLVCLARAIVSKKEYLILDEATSGLDPETDAKIIKVLKKEFAGKTVITIAHRLETIRDYDWVIELAQGELARQGHPSKFFNASH